MGGSSKNQKGFTKSNLCSSSKSTDDGYEDEERDNSNDGYFSNEKNFLLCGIICTKSMVIIFNFLFILSGIFLILFGVWTLTFKQEYVTLLSSHFYQLSIYILIVAGVLIILTGIMGILSAWFEAKRILIAFIVLLVIIFVTEITAGVLAFAYRTQLNKNLKLDLETLILKEYNQTNFEDKSKLLDDLQVKFKCCGAVNYMDWRESKYVQAQNSSLPKSEKKNYNLVAESCCKTPSLLCAKRTHPSNINYKGCVTPLENYISKHILLIAVVGISSSLFQSIGLFLAVLLIKRINQRKQYEHLKTNEN